jgi:hypothetical protein
MGNDKDMMVKEFEGVLGQLAKEKDKLGLELRSVEEILKE